MSDKIAIGILGGTGFGAQELLRILSQHPEAELLEIVSTSKAGTALAEEYPQLADYYPQLRFVGQLSADTFKAFKRKMLFSTQPNSASAEFLSLHAKSLIDQGFKIIDLSGALRLKETEQHMRYYPDVQFAQALSHSAVYGLPELFAEEIATAKLIANPGCFATAAILASAPLIASNLTTCLNIFGITGSSGSGKNLKNSTHHPYRANNFFAYKELNHQHTPEILQTLKVLNKEQFEINFVPHSAPLVRGIYLSLIAKLSKQISESDLTNLYESFYKSAPFVKISTNSPELRLVQGTNTCELGLTISGNNLAVTCTLDNLVKGMAGQAVQNMNLMFGIEQTVGLNKPGLGF